MRILGTVIIGLIILCIEVFLGVQSFYPQALQKEQADIVQKMIENKKTIVDELSEDELAWLAQNKVVQVGVDANFYPLETFNERGQYTGIGGDYLRLLSSMTGINFQVQRQQDWATVEELAQLKRIDMFMALAKTERRAEYLTFAEPFINLPGMIMVPRTNTASDLTLNDLKGKKLAVVKNYYWDDYVSANYPDIERVPASDTINAMHMVTNGEADAVIDYEFNLNEKIQVAGIYQLHTVGQVPSEFGHSIAVRSDLPELFSIVTKALKQISPDEQKVLIESWLIKSKPAGDERRLQWYFFFFTQAVLLILLIVSYVKSMTRKAVIAKAKEVRHQL